ncbi:hypothetical protein EDC01DRAFT_627046 [Geopyxis carbonaria]|nr:hypothetical protein EDC01DRAFT_627046 [Geopyxis carbonaria]
MPPTNSRKRPAPYDETPVGHPIERLPPELHLDVVEKLMTADTAEGPRALSNWLASNEFAAAVFRAHGKPMLKRHRKMLLRELYGNHFTVVAEQFTEDQDECMDVAENYRDWVEFERSFFKGGR